MQGIFSMFVGLLFVIGGLFGVFVLQIILSGVVMALSGLLLIGLGTYLVLGDHSKESLERESDLPS